MDITAQSEFRSALLDRRRPAPSGLVCRNGGDPARRFAVHRNNVMASLIDALAATFPAVRALVGDRFFRAMAREYVQAQPPRSRLLVEHGSGLADFIAAFAPAAPVPCLADVARLEMLRVEVFHAADAMAVPAEAYQALLADPARLAATRITLHPACGWLRSMHPVGSIWHAHQGLPDIDAADLAAIDFERGEDVLVVRPQLEVYVLALPAGGFEWLRALHAGATLGDAAAQAAAASSDFTLAPLLALLLQHGLAIALISPPGAAP